MAIKIKKIVNTSFIDHRGYYWTSWQKKSIKNIYTKVLKGHIAVATSNLKKFNTGKKVDNRARQFLKKDGLDYAHGTGHGVGFFSNVHEGPQSITKINTVKLEKGMIVSNEPGYYKKGHYGIRIENLVYIKKNNNKLYFENLTLAPIEKDLIPLIDKIASPKRAFNLSCHEI